MRLQCAVTDSDGSAIVLDNGNTTGQSRSLYPSTRTEVAVVAAVHAMNEVTLHRGASQHLTIIDTYVDKQLFTESVVRSSFPSHFASHLILNAGRWTTTSDANRIDSILPLGRRADRSSLRAIIAPHSDRSEKFELQTGTATF